MRLYSDADLKFERAFQKEVLQTSVYGAFMSVIETRKEENGLTQANLATLTGKDKTGVSKLLSEPKNWTIRTVSDLCVALDVQFLFCLIDNTHETRVFTGTGVEHVNLQRVGFGNIITAQAPQHAGYADVPSPNTATFAMAFNGSTMTFTGGTLDDLVVTSPAPTSIISIP